MRPVSEDDETCRKVQTHLNFTLVLCICWYVSLVVDTHVRGVFDSVSASTQPIPTEFCRGRYPENGGSRLPCCEIVVVVCESINCYITETGHFYAHNVLT